MTHNANKRRDHNDAARAAKQRVRGKAGKAGQGTRRTGYGNRLAGLRAKAADARTSPGGDGEEEE